MSGNKSLNKLTGNKGEQLAAVILKKNGYTILHRNYRGKYGEIDIIARDGDVVVFIEVKTRNSDNFCNTAYAVNQTKQKKIRQTALEYITLNSITDCDFRFDVVILVKNGKIYKEEIIKNAFTDDD